MIISTSCGTVNRSLDPVPISSFPWVLRALIGFQAGFLSCGHFAPIIMTKLRTLARPHHHQVKQPILTFRLVHVNGCKAEAFHPIRSLTASQNLLAKEPCRFHSNFLVSLCRRQNSALVSPRVFLILFNEDAIFFLVNDDMPINVKTPIIISLILRYVSLYQFSLLKLKLE